MTTGIKNITIPFICHLREHFGLGIWEDWRMGDLEDGKLGGFEDGRDISVFKSFLMIF